MLRKMEDMIGFTVQATDGEVGKVDDFYFDEEEWVLRYAVVDTGPWLFGRRVLVSAVALQLPEWEAGNLPVELDKSQVESSPRIDLGKPVSRQQEAVLHAHYGWPTYWTGAAAPTMGPVRTTEPYPATTMVPETAPETVQPEGELEPAELKDPDLHSLREITGYHISARDGEIGHLSDLFVSEADWIIRYLLIDTRNWLPGKHVLVAPDWVQQVSWGDAMIHVDLPRQKIKDSPEYEPAQPIDRAYESELYRYYGYPGYWV